MVKINTGIFLIAALTLAVSHFFFLEFYLYWRYEWIDMPMHFLGGVVAGLGFLALPDFFPKLNSRWLSVWSTLSFVILVAIGWEIFEVAIGVIFDEGQYILDTSLDLLFGTLGGLVAYVVGTNIKQL